MSDLLQFVRFKDLDNWSVKNNLASTVLISDFSFIKLQELIRPRKEKIKKNEYQGNIDIVKKISFKDGKIHIRDKRTSGMDMYKIYPNDLLVSKINFHQGALSINELNNELLSSTHYQPYIINNNVYDHYLVMILRSKVFQDYISYLKSDGIKTEATFEFIKSLKIPLPPLKVQQQLVKSYQNKLDLAKQKTEQAQQKEAEIETYLYQALGIELPTEKIQNNDILQFVQFKNLSYWSYEQLLLKSSFDSKYGVTNFVDIFDFKSKRFDKFKYEQKKFNYVDIGSIDPLMGIMNNKKIHIKEAPSRATQYINTGDLIIATTRPYLKKFAIVGNEFNNNICSSGFTVIQQNISKYNLYYIKEFLQSFYGIEQLKEHMTGGLYPAITLAKLKNIQIPLPPLKIQNQIASHIQNIKDEITELKQQAEQNQKSALSEFEAEIFTRQASIEQNNAS